MAAHTDFGGRHSCEGRVLDRAVAIPAIDPQTGHMVLMAERHLLNARYGLVGRVGGAVHRIHQPPKTKETHKNPHQRRSREAVAAFPKNLSHDSAPLAAPRNADLCAILPCRNESIYSPE